MTAFGGLVCYLLGFLPDTTAYGRVLLGLALYLLYPFGKFVRLEQDEAYAQEDEGEGRSITEYEQWQSGDLEDGRLFFGPLATPSTIVGRRRAASMESADENSWFSGSRWLGLLQSFLLIFADIHWLCPSIRTLLTLAAHPRHLPPFCSVHIEQSV